MKGKNQTQPNSTTNIALAFAPRHRFRVSRLQSGSRSRRLSVNSFWTRSASSKPSGDARGEGFDGLASWLCAS